MELPKESLSEAIAAKEKKPASPIRNPFRKRRKTKDKDGIDNNNQQRPRVILPTGNGNESDYSATDDESYLPKSLQFDPTMMEALGLSLSASAAKAKMGSGSASGSGEGGTNNHPLAGVTPYDSDEDTLSEEPPPSKTKKETATSSTASAEDKSNELGDGDGDGDGNGEYTATDNNQNNSPSSTAHIERKVSLTPKLGNTNYDNTSGDGDGNGVDSGSDDIPSLEVELIEDDDNDSVMGGYAADSNGNGTSNTDSGGGGDSTRKSGIGNSRSSPLLVGGTYKYKHQRKQKKSQLPIGDSSDEEMASKDANIIDCENNGGVGNDSGSGSDVGSTMPKSDADAISSDNIAEKVESGKESQAIAASQDLPPQSQGVDDSVDESIADSSAESIVTDGGGVDSSVEQEEISSRRQVHTVDDDDISVSSVTALLAKAHQAPAAAENDGNAGDVGVDVDGNGDTSFTSFATAASTEQHIPVPVPVSSKPALSTISSMTSSMIPPPPPHSPSSAPSHPPLPPVPLTRQRSILRNSSLDRMSRSSSNDSNDSRGSDRNLRINRTNSDGSVRKAVSFADENGGTIHKQHTIAVSPNKLTRRVRRNKGSGLPPYYDSPAEDTLGGNGISDGSGSGVLTMGRILVLLMDPPTKQYELTSLPYPLVSNENGVVGPTQLGTLLGLVSKSASYEPLREKSYLGFCRPSLDDITAHFNIDADGKEDGMTDTLVKEKKMMKNDLSVLDHKIVKDEVLVAVPDGYSAQDCLKFSLPILQDKRLVRLLKKLKKHERKAEKKRRMKVKSMKPNRSSSSSMSSDPSDGRMDAKESTLERTLNGGHTYDWKSIVAGGIVLLLLLSFIAGSYHTAFSNKIKSTRGRHRSSVIKKETCLGRGRICKPTFVRASSTVSPEKKNNWLKQLLSDLKLEEEILI